MLPTDLSLVRTALIVATTCALLAGFLFVLHLRHEKRKAQEMGVRLNARIIMEQHWHSQATDGRTLMMDGEALRRGWKL